MRNDVYLFFNPKSKIQNPQSKGLSLSILNFEF